LMTDMKTIIDDLRHIKFELPTTTEICRVIDDQLAGLSSDYLGLLATNRTFTIPPAALAYNVYSTWICHQSGEYATDAQLSVFCHTIATFRKELQWDVHAKFASEFVRLRNGSSISPLNTACLQILEDMFTKREDQLLSRFTSCINSSVASLPKHFQEVACQDWPDSQTAHVHLADLIAVSRVVSQETADDDWDTQPSPSKSKRLQSTIDFNPRSSASRERRRGRVRPVAPNPTDISTLLTCKTPPHTQLAILNTTLDTVKSIRLDGLGSDTGHPQAIVTPHMQSCTESDVAAQHCEFVCIVNFYEEDKNRDQIEVQHVLSRVGDTDDTMTICNGLTLDVEYFDSMYSTRGWQVHRHESLRTTHSNFHSGILIKLKTRALFGTFYVSSASGTILPAVSTIKDRFRSRFYVVYAIPVHVDVQKLSDAEMYGSLGVLRGLPGRNDHHAGTVACLNSIRSALDVNMSRPGRYAILLHNVFHQVIVNKDGNATTFLKPSGVATDTQTRSELVAEVVFLGTESDRTSHVGSPSYNKAWTRLFLGVREDRQPGNSEPILLHLNGFPLELFESLGACLACSHRHAGFRTPRVTVLNNVPHAVLAQDLLAVLARDAHNQLAIQEICQAIVVPPVRNFPYRLLITWLVQIEEALDVRPLEQHWNVSPNTIHIDEGWYPGYADLMRLKDMPNNFLPISTEPILDMGTIFRTPDLKASVFSGRGGRGGRIHPTAVGRSGMSDTIPLPTSDISVVGHMTSTLSPTTDSYSSVVRRTDPDLITVIGSIIDQKLAPMTERLNALSVQTAQLEQERIKADLDRKIAQYTNKVNTWYIRHGAAIKSSKEQDYLQRELGNLRSLRNTILTLAGDLDADALPEIQDF